MLYVKRYSLHDKISQLKLQLCVQVWHCGRRPRSHLNKSLSKKLDVSQKMTLLQNTEVSIII